MAQRARVTWNGPRIVEELRAAGVRGVSKAAEHLLGEARDLVPLEEGTLERSGKVVVNESEISATVVFDTVYAVIQHEDMTLRHAPGRQAKYLEQPMTEQRDTMQDIVAAELRRAMR